MTDVNHPNTKLCHHCGAVEFIDQPLPLDFCLRCDGTGKIAVRHEKCGHVVGSEMCGACGGTGKRLADIQDRQSEGVDQWD